MKIGIVGWGVEGRSVYEYFGPDHQYLIVNEHPRDDFPAESDTVKLQFLSGDKPAGITGNVEDLSYLDGIEACDKIVYTPTSLKNLEKKYAERPEFWQKATTALHIFFENSPSKNLIGITGTKGKGTTSTLIYQMLRASGKAVHLGGNIGVSILDLLPKIQPDDWVVIELANFQLYKFPYSPPIAVCLMIVPEHLDWHPTFEDYLEAKSNIFRHQKPEDIAIYFPFNQNSKKIAQFSPGKKIPYFMQPGAYIDQAGMIMINDQVIIDQKEVKLLGEHNLQNICAAVTAFWQVAQDKEAVKKVVSGFSGLEHRLEFVREIDGVKYYDDSFGTTPTTAIVAIHAFKAPKIVILGGSDKGATFEELAKVISGSNVRNAIVIGQIAGKIISALKQAGFEDIITGAQSMPEIVNKAKEVAEPGDVVLLSTAAASFDMFTDYKDRGNQFKAAVQALS
jgi:UDP-N-acetylmuramoylalanine--D-glutamate ligase